MGLLSSESESEIESSSEEDDESLAIFFLELLSSSEELFSTFLLDLFSESVVLFSSIIFFVFFLKLLSLFFKACLFLSVLSSSLSEDEEDFSFLFDEDCDFFLLFAFLEDNEEDFLLGDILELVSSDEEDFLLCFLRIVDTLANDILDKDFHFIKNF